MMAKSFIILVSSVLLFLVGSTLSAPPTPSEQENNEKELTLVLVRLNHLEAEMVEIKTELAIEKEKNRLQEIEISNLKQLSAQHVPTAKKNKEVGADGRAVLYPRSCREIADNGQNIDGIYLVEYTSTRIGAVFCEFVLGSPVETPIGIVDIKTSSVQFYVQRSSSYSSGSTVIPWQVTRLNLGNAMSTESGVFTAPKDGVYHFHFSAYSDIMYAATLRLNGGVIGHGFSYQRDNQSIHSTLQLKKGDTVDMYLDSGSISDNSPDHLFNHFTGWLDEEDLVIS